MYQFFTAIPAPEDISARCGQDMCVIDLGHHVSIHVTDRAVLEAFATALGEIRVAIDAQDARDQVPTEECDWPAGPPGEALGVFGK